MPMWIHAGRMKRPAPASASTPVLDQMRRTQPRRPVHRKIVGQFVGVLAIFFDARRPGDRSKRAYSLQSRSSRLRHVSVGVALSICARALTGGSAGGNIHRELCEQHVGRVVPLDEIRLFSGLRQRHRETIAVVRGLMQPQCDVAVAKS